MDTALELKLQNKHLSDNDILRLLNNSKIIKKLTKDYQEKPLYAIWRIVALSEIPYSNKLDYTQRVIKYIKMNLFVGDAFSFTGQKDGIVPCYNAMIIESLTKLGEYYSIEVQKAIEWIKEYQFFHRGGVTTWKGKGIYRFGGCLKSTPCYIGVVKTLKALLHYRNITEIKNTKIEDIIHEATQYVKQHEFCYRLSSKEPITRHILDPAFPASYVLNIIELLEIAKLTNNIKDVTASKMINHLKKIQNENKNWGVGYQYKSEGYISFDGNKKNADWITSLINSYLND